MKRKVAVLGAGAWGTAIAVLLATGGHRVTLATRRREHLAEMISSRENRSYLPKVEIDPDIELTIDWRSAISRADLIVMAVPSRYARDAMTPLADSLAAGASIVSATKGIESDSLMTMTAMLHSIAPDARVAAVSGPSFAAEVARGKPAALVAAAEDESFAREIQAVFTANLMRVYTSSDVVGVELSGASKNAIAIAAGIGDGMDLGSSARAAVITRGLAEIMRLVAASGGRRETVSGLAGLGDLVLTCTGDLSRNRMTGIRLGRGETIDPTSNRAHGAPVAEGVTNARAIDALARRLGVEMPIVRAVVRALYERTPPKDIVGELLSRELKSEF